MAKTYEPIASVPAASASEVIFSNIPGTYTDLVVMWSGTASGPRDVFIQFNSDTASNYSRTTLYGTGSSASSLRTSNASRIITTVVGYPNSSSIATMVCHVMSYANSNVNKTVLISMGAAATGIDQTVGLWRSMSAITSMRLYLDTGTFSSGTFSLYGIKAKSPVVPLLTESTKTASSVSAIISNYDAGLTYTASSTAGTATVSTNTVSVTGLNPDTSVTITVTATDGSNSSSSNVISITTGPVATGGTVTEAGGYRNHTFTSSGTFTLNANKSVEYLVVAGGGGGVYDGGGGGGAGGMLTSTGTNLTAGSYAITVGGGGATNVNGSDSSIGSAVISIGGGGRGSPSYNGAPGGSGGGGKFDGVGGSATPGQGNSGSPGRGAFGSNLGSGAGGGGKGAAGQKVGAAGGSGELWNGVYYAGGGGGGGGYGGGAGSGGQGGGGAGGNPISVGSNGTTNTGGGAGGGGVNQNGGTGGSGIVIIRYPV